MDRYIKRNDVYALFGKSGMANLHVADIDMIQDADVVPVVHGRWINGHYDARGEYIEQCSYCNSWMDQYGCKSASYCPNCGAKMCGD